jgi:hypothetical protein
MLFLFLLFLFLLFLYLFLLICHCVHARVLLGPVYTLFLLVVLRRLSRARGAVWLAIYLVAVCITLLPAHLFEFRYFTPGAVIALINMPPVSRQEWVDEAIHTCHRKGIAVIENMKLFILLIFHFLA